MFMLTYENLWHAKVQIQCKQTFEPKIVKVFLSVGLNIDFWCSKNNLIETVLLSTHKICFGREIWKQIFNKMLSTGSQFNLDGKYRRSITLFSQNIQKLQLPTIIMINSKFDFPVYNLMLFVLIDFSLTVKAATLIFISGRGLAITSAKQGKSDSI